MRFADLHGHITYSYGSRDSAAVVYRPANKVTVRCAQAIGPISMNRLIFSSEAVRILESWIVNFPVGVFTS